MKTDRVDKLSGRGLAVLFALTAAALVAYEVLRAARVSLTFDEAATRMMYLSSSFFAVFDLRSANNHLLYSFLSRIAAAVAGSSELSLRLPSLLGYLAYLAFSWALMKRFFGRVAALAGFLLLNLNPFVLDFFALARGYGLALGLEMAALYFFTAFLDPRTTDEEGRTRALGTALLLSLASALANLAFLNVFLGLWIYAGITFFVKNLRSEASQPADAPKPSGRVFSRWTLAAAALAIPFNLIVIGQCLRLAEGSMGPVVVRVLDPGGRAMSGVQIFGTDLYGNEVPFSPKGGAWLPPKTIHLRRLKLGFSQPALEAVGDVEIRTGARGLHLSRADLLALKHHGEGDVRYFLYEAAPPGGGSVFRDMRAVFNWRGDRVFFGAFTRQAVATAVVLALLLAVIYGLSRIASGLGRLRQAEARPLAGSAALAVLYFLYPIYALNRNQALYYGGQEGFIRNTVYSLIGDSFYGRRYAAGQERYVFWILLGLAALALFGMAGRILKKRFGAGDGDFALLAVAVIAALVISAQRALFGTPYLMGRTAVFFIPLAVLFLLFAVNEAWRRAGVRRFVATVLLVLAVGLSAFHLSRTANLTRTEEWGFDADTKAMIGDVASLKRQAFPGKDRVRLGVDWLYWPTSVYYGKRLGLDWLDVFMLPTPWPCDIYYVPADQPPPGSTAVLKKYPLSGSVLFR